MAQAAHLPFRFRPKDIDGAMVEDRLGTLTLLDGVPSAVPATKA